MGDPTGVGEHSLVAAVRRFVDTEVRPVAAELERADRYPHALVARMRELGLFGCLVPAAHGGLGLDVTTYARIVEELCRGWMSLAGVINSHTMASLIVLGHGTDEQRRRFLPRFARGEARGGLALTEPHAGSDVQAIRTTARRRGDAYLITGSKMFITNGREGNTFALLALTEPAAQPRHRGMSCFIVEKGSPGFTVLKSIGKLGYRGVDTVELLFEDCVVPAANLVGGVEGRGFKQVMGGLETGRLNIAARAVGVARAAFDEALAHVRAAGASPAPPALVDMATRLTAARLVTYWGAGMKDRGERCDVEAGMAKLLATETAQELAVAALRLQGHDRTTTPVERHYRDTPLMIIGEGTNEIQRLLIARQLLERQGERTVGLLAREAESEEQRQMVLAVRQLVERAVVPALAAPGAAVAYPKDAVEALAEMGVLGATVAPEHGGLGLDGRTCAMLLEELGRGSLALAAAVATHLAAARAIGRLPGRGEREALLPAMTRGELLGACAPGGGLTARHDGDAWVLAGALPPVDLAGRAGVLVVAARAADGGPVAAVLRAGLAGLEVGAPVDTLGGRGLEPCPVVLREARVPASRVLAGDAAAAALGPVSVGLAAMAVGLAQAALEASVRYARERTAFGKPIGQHQAIQLKLADMATRITAARLLTERAALDAEARPGDDLPGRLARLHAAECAGEVTLEAMRIHGGYGYTTEFPIERYYRDAARLPLVPWPVDTERAALAGRLALLA